MDQLIEGMPQSLILEGPAGDLHILASATAKPVRVLGSKGNAEEVLAGGLLLDRNNAQW